MKEKKLYEIYHSNRVLQKRVISRNDFTYQVAIKLIHKYNFYNKKILDIGCGTGTLDFYIAQNGGFVNGIDVSNKAIDIASKSAKSMNLSSNVNFLKVDFPKFFPKEKFDMIICTEILEHIDDDFGAVKKIKKMLRKKGVVIATSPSSNSPLYKMGLLDKFDSSAGHLRRYTKDSYLDLFKKNGFKIVEVGIAEGILRNWLYTTRLGGFLLKFIKRWPISTLFTLIDRLTIPIFGESDIFLVATI